MTAIRGPGPEPRPLVLSQHEMGYLLQVKPTPYMDEADLPDPSWALPVDTVASQASADAAYLLGYYNWYQEFFGKEHG